MTEDQAVTGSTRVNEDGETESIRVELERVEVTLTLRKEGVELSVRGPATCAPELFDELTERYAGAKGYVALGQPVQTAMDTAARIKQRKAIEAAIRGRR